MGESSKLRAGGSIKIKVKLNLRVIDKPKEEETKRQEK